jgi:hypothetical protein
MGHRCSGSQADYVQANSDFDNEIYAITQQLNASHSQHGTLDAFLRFSKLMLVVAVVTSLIEGFERNLLAPTENCFGLRDTAILCRQ